MDISANTRNHEKHVVGGLLEVGRLRLIVSWTMITVYFEMLPLPVTAVSEGLYGYLTTKNGSLRVVTVTGEARQFGRYQFFARQFPKTPGTYLYLEPVCLSSS